VTPWACFRFIFIHGIAKDPRFEPRGLRNDRHIDSLLLGTVT